MTSFVGSILDKMQGKFTSSGFEVTLPNFCITSSTEASSDSIPSSSSMMGFKEATRLQYRCLSSVNILHGGQNLIKSSDFANHVLKSSE